MQRRLTALSGLLLLAACSDVCRNTPIVNVQAPDGVHSAAMFQRDCGATTGFSTDVSILKAGEVASGNGGAFVADDDHGAARAGPWGGPWAEIKWLNGDHLMVRYAAKSRIFKQEAHVSGIRISYEQVGP